MHRAPLRSLHGACCCRHVADCRGLSTRLIAEREASAAALGAALAQCEAEGARAADEAQRQRLEEGEAMRGAVAAAEAETEALREGYARTREAYEHEHRERLLEQV